MVAFLDQRALPCERVPDIGCGQGRDAVSAARCGHHVVGVDMSVHGVRDMERAARRGGLSIARIVAEITTFRPEGVFDVVLIDRTLHMLVRPARLGVLARLLDHVAAGGWLLIVDERSNIADFDKAIADHPDDWTIHER